MLICASVMYSFSHVSVIDRNGIGLPFGERIVSAICGIFHLQLLVAEGEIL